MMKETGRMNTEVNAYQTIRNKLKEDECVILDGAIATELQRLRAPDFALSDDVYWGFDALHRSPETVKAVHASYLDAGADIMTTNTYSILEAPTYTGQLDFRESKPVHWMNLARTAIELPQQVIHEAGKTGRVATAFSIGGDIETEAQQETVKLLLKVFNDVPPDLILFETVSLIEDNLTIPTIEMLIDLGWPVWVSFRRCRKGVCGIHGQLWGGPEGDRFGRLAQKLELIGVDALLINCLPMHRVEGTLPWLRDFTDLPLGVYPNVGRYLETGWKFDSRLRAEQFGDIALQWRKEGANIIGGCCGVGPEEVSLTARKVAGTSAGERVFRDKDSRQKPPARSDSQGKQMGHSHKELDGWKDKQGRLLYPLPIPKTLVDRGVFVPTQGSYLIWKYLFNHGIGQDKRCLDIGCGAGILAIQLALNGAQSVSAIDIHQASVDNTMTNAFRNGVAEKLTGAVADLYSYEPEYKFDVIVASLYQMPTDPKGHYSSHRDIDYWGRNLLDHLIRELPNLLEKKGVAYLMQVSMLGAERTQQLLERQGYQSRVIDFNLYHFNPVFEDNLAQIEKVEALSDAYHFSFDGQENVMVMYLLEVCSAPPPPDGAK